MCAKDPMNEFIDVKKGDTNLIDTSKFSPLCLNTPMKWDFVEKAKYYDTHIAQHYSKVHRSFLQK